MENKDNNNQFSSRTFGSKLRNIRLQKKLSQEQVANKLSISRHTYADIENGFRPLNMQRCHQLAQLFDLDTMKFIQYLYSSDTSVYIDIIGKNEKGGVSAYNMKIDQGLSEKEKEFYEKQITTLNEHITDLRKQIEYFRSEKKK